MSANHQAIITLLETIRNSTEALIVLLEEEERKGPCQHPESARQDISTMGRAVWQCGVCGHIEEA